MSTFQEILHNEAFVAIITSTIIFFITILLVAKKWIGFWTTFLLLLFSIGAGLAIGHYRTIQNYAENYQNPNQVDQEELDGNFKTQIKQAVENLKKEVDVEKDTLDLVVKQVNEILNQLDVQKQKLQHFIEETHERFKSEKEDKK